MWGVLVYEVEYIIIICYGVGHGSIVWFSSSGSWVGVFGELKVEVQVVTLWVLPGGA